MKQSFVVIVAAFLFVSLSVEASAHAKDNELTRLKRQFRAHTGSTLVFSRQALPTGHRYYDRMYQLRYRRRVKAARIALVEGKKYPRNYLARIGLRRVGLFDALVAKRGDGFRPYNRMYNGYLFYGLWNGANAVVAAYYSDTQLPLTLHHEWFHHVDSTRRGRTSYKRYFASDDKRFRAAIAGRNRYRAPTISRHDLRLLKRKSQRYVLRGAVSHYASKTSGEDQAETARYLMTTLPAALVQVVEQSQLAGSQRILHVLDQYRRASRRGPGISWFVDVALQRNRQQANPYLHKVDAAISTAKLRVAIRGVQPATVRLSNGSGVNLTKRGLILTNAHVAKRRGSSLTVQFPDGRKFHAKTLAIDHRVDLALLEIRNGGNLPIAPVARSAPSVGSWVAAIGQPGQWTPSKQPTNYTPFHVSVGTIRGFLSNRLASTPLGATKHDAWTYWGHSGSPLFNRHGAIVALHNTWDSTTAMRHAVAWEGIVRFLRTHHVAYVTR